MNSQLMLQIVQIQDKPNLQSTFPEPFNHGGGENDRRYHIESNIS